jgi:hypothetical protein
MTLQMQTTPLSTNVAQIGYDPETSELVVVFQKGGRYVYAGVPAALAESVMSAPSVGSALNSDIKGFYPHRRA